MPSDRAKVIYVFGLSYCGSTLLNYILDSHPSIYGGGEFHSLVRGNDEYSKLCTACGKGCKYWTNENIQSITKSNLYKRISEIFNTNIIVNTSKSWEWFNKSLSFDSELIFDYVPVVLVKHPIRHLASFMINTMRQPLGNNEVRKSYVSLWMDNVCQSESLDNPSYRDKIREEMLNWYINFISNSYLRELKHILNYCKNDQPIILRYEDVINTLEIAVAPLLSKLGLDFVESMHKCYEFTHHSIGGNNGAYFQFRNDVDLSVYPEVRKKFYQSFKGIKMDNKYERFFTEKEINELSNNPLVLKLCDLFAYSPLPKN